jgi:uncharacterized protein (DUF1800 family)
MKKSASFINKFAAVVSVWAMLAPVAMLRAETGPGSAKPLTEDQKILHVLNRLGFGARPGDVERVKAMGLQKYIDQQLNPSAIDDSATEAKVKNLDVFNLSTSEIFAKYPNPGALLRQLDGVKKGQKANVDATQQKVGDQQMTPITPGQPLTPAQNQNLSADEQKQRQAELRELYIKYDLHPAAQILPQIVSNRVIRDVYSERQLQEVMVDFWQNHFNVFSGKNAVRWYIPSYERDVLRPNALGNFRDLLLGTAKSPAMLFYLDNFQNVSPNSPQPGRGGNGKGNGQNALQNYIRNGGVLTPQMRDRMRQNGATDAQIDQRIAQLKNGQQQPQAKKQQRGINENYARELMELHTLGVDNGYQQKDIIEVAKCFTGWTIADPTGYRRVAALDIEGKNNRKLNQLQRMPGVPDDLDSGEFFFNPQWHEGGAKMVMGQKIDAGGMKDGLAVIDMLVDSPYTAKFIAKKLAIKFVSDNPSDALVQRVADAFHSSRGDIKTTLRAIFTSPEFFAPENYRVKIKTPYELAISSIRTLGGDTTGSPAFVAMLNKLGEVPYGWQAPTGYPDKAEDWVNTGALLERLNYAIAVASNRIPGTRVDLKQFASADKSQVLDKAIAEILHGEISPGTKATLLKQIQSPLPEVKTGTDMTQEDMTTDNMQAVGGGGKRGGGPQARLLNPSGDPETFKVVSLVLGTPEFQRQ